MRFHGPMGFARRCVVCSARGLLCARDAAVSLFTHASYVSYTRSLFLCSSLILGRSRINVYAREREFVRSWYPPVRERNEGARVSATPPRRGKVPTESREESKRRPCPLQTTGSSFSRCFSPGSSSLLPLLSHPLSPAGPSAGPFDWRVRAEEEGAGGEVEEPRERAREKERPGG